MIESLCEGLCDGLLKDKNDGDKELSKTELSKTDSKTESYKRFINVYNTVI